MFALLALSEQGEGIGLAHCVVHPSTWSEAPSCYLEDLFVAPTARDRISAEPSWRRQSGHRSSAPAGRLYWHTQSYNGRARSLYDLVARPTSFVVYEM